MKVSSLGLLFGLTASAIAEDVLFVDTLQFEEYTEATTVLGLTAKVVTKEEWLAMSTSDFAAFKSIVLADPYCSRDPSELQYLVDTKNTWGPAVTGNMILIGTDPSFHFSSEPGAKTLIDSAVQFSAAGVSATGVSQTGLYFALSCYYDTVDTATVDVLSYFGDFGVRGNLDCYNNAHIVASSPALGTLDDAALSDWECSVHEAFSVYPSVGINGFQSLAIAKDIIGEGSQTFGDGTIGLPYIISRGATPAGCGDGHWDPTFGEECDDGNTKPGDGCSASCKCESGLPSGDGHCLPAPGGNTSTTRPPYYHNSTATVTDTVTATSTYCPPYVTPALPDGPKIIGIEIIIYITIIESCTTIGDKTITEYITSTCSTMNKPIWDHDKSGYPCYVCALSSEGISTSKFITASTTSCIDPPPTYVPKPPVILPCHSCEVLTLSTCPAYTSITAETVYEVPVVTLVSHTHHPAPPTTVVTSTAAAIKTSAGASFPAPSATSTYVPFTGGAAKMNNAGIVLGLLGGALAAIMVAL